MLQMCVRIQEARNFKGIRVHFAAIKIFLAGTEIDEIPHPAGQIRNPVLCGQAQAGKEQLTILRRRKKLSVFSVLFGAAVFLIAGIIFSAQPMKSPFSCICIINFLRCNVRPGFQTILCQIHRFCIQHFSLLCSQGKGLLFILHLSPSFSSACRSVR